MEICIERYFESICKGAKQRCNGNGIASYAFQIGFSGAATGGVCDSVSSVVEKWVGLFSVRFKIRIQAK